MWNIVCHNGNRLLNATGDTDVPNLSIQVVVSETAEGQEPVTLYRRPALFDRS